MSQALRVLIIEDAEDDALLMARALQDGGYEPDWLRVETADAMAAALDERQWDAVLADYRLPRFDAPAALAVLHDSGLDLPFIVISGTVGEDIAVEVMKAGAHDFFAKGQLKRLVPAIEREMREAENRHRRRVAEEALRESERQYRLLADNTLDVIWTMDMQLRFTYVNRAIKLLTGHTPEEWIGTRLSDHCDEANLAQMGQVIQQEIAKGPDSEGVVFETEMLRRDRSPIPLEIHGKVIFDNGAPVSIQGTTRDITERRRAEQALEAYSERLEEMVEERTRALRDAQDRLVRQEKLALLGQLASGVAHELRNPLGAIKNGAYFLNMALEVDVADPDVQETLEILQREVDRSERIIAGLLDFAEAEPPVRRKVDVNDVVRAALSRADVPENVEVVSQLDEALPHILADPGQLDQAFGNLIRNAVQAMASPPPGGTGGGAGSASTPRAGGTGGGALTIRTFKTPGGVAVSIADTGVGIPEENRERIFEPLFSTRTRGIGLGLALVKMLVEAHEGTVEVESEVGEGSTFIVKLPGGAEEPGEQGSRGERVRKHPGQRRV
jgi:hypothetical protein